MCLPVKPMFIWLPGIITMWFVMIWQKMKHWQNIPVYPTYRIRNMQDHWKYCWRIQVSIFLVIVIIIIFTRTVVLAHQLMLFVPGNLHVISYCIYFFLLFIHLFFISFLLFILVTSFFNFILHFFFFHLLFLPPLFYYNSPIAPHPVANNE